MYIYIKRDIYVSKVNTEMSIEVKKEAHKKKKKLLAPEPDVHDSGELDENKSWRDLLNSAATAFYSEESLGRVLAHAFTFDSLSHAVEPGLCPKGPLFPEPL